MKLYLDLLALILALLLGIYVFLSGFLKKINEWRHVSSLGEKKHSLPSGDMGWLIIGNMRSFLKAFRSNDPDTFIYDFVQRYGRMGVYKTYLFGSPSIIVSIPETCRKVFADDEQFKLGYPISTKQLTGKKSFHSIPNSEHKRLRRLTTASIDGHEAQSMYIGYIEEMVVKSLEEWSTMKEPIELLNEIRKFTFKVIAHIFVGSSAESIMGSVEELYTDLNHGMKSAAINFPCFAFHKALKVPIALSFFLYYHLRGRTQLLESKPFPDYHSPDSSRSQSGVRLLSPTCKFRVSVNSILFMGHLLSVSHVPRSQNHLKLSCYHHVADDSVLLTLFLPCYQHSSGHLPARKMLIKILREVLDERRVKSEVIEPNLAGHESSAHVAMWAILYLHNHPQTLKDGQAVKESVVLARDLEFEQLCLQEEQEEILKKRQSAGKGLTLKDARQMNYLQKVIDETMRRASVSFCNFWEAKVDININGYLIPKGWMVVLWNRGVHMDPKFIRTQKNYSLKDGRTTNPGQDHSFPLEQEAGFAPELIWPRLRSSFSFIIFYLTTPELEQINPGGPDVYLPLPRPVGNCLAKVVKIE
ncbi:Ent-kaurenoic acid oxidase 1 [Hibiscus syriacus]|uniref:Ent-kaurenoic acid oxidase 1 n=1 Tax=Hibiscus syriacus TaxID=106335 RepID=A0A6A3CBU3_HIBSY|nr:Ent-kaurenoic acid oxidase 1 [Hibiscus syriacus]